MKKIILIMAMISALGGVRAATQASCTNSSATCSTDGCYRVLVSGNCSELGAGWGEVAVDSDSRRTVVQSCTSSDAGGSFSLQCV